MPNTISDLNDFSNGSLTYEDQRAYSIAFSANATTNQSVSTTEDVAFASPVGIDIVSVISQPGNITYNIDTSNIGSNAIVTWANIPATVSSSSPSTGVYSLTGYWDDVVWNAVKSPQITAKDETSSFVYSANIQYPTVANVANTATWSWTVNVAVSNSHAELSSATNFVYDEDVPMTISGTPTITDAYSGPLSHILTITPNVANAVYSLSVASANVTSNLNPTTKVLTLTGTKANVNTALGNVWLIPGIDYEQNFQLTYQLTNPVSNLQTSVTQQANIGNTEVDFVLQSTHTYDEDGQTQLVFSCNDANTPTLISLTVAFTQTSGTNGTMFVNGVNAGVGNTASFTGNTAQFNAANVTFFPYADAVDPVVISANVWKVNAFGNNQIVSNATTSLTVANTHADYSLTTTYNYTEDSDVAMVWDVTDTDIRANSYTATFTQTAGTSGAFLINGTSQGVGMAATVTGDKSTVNAANVTFVPYPDDTGNIAIGYNQSKINTLFGNVVQATNVAIAVTNTGSHADYSLTTSYNFAEDAGIPIVFSVTDTDSRAANYTVTMSQTSGNTGAFVVNSVSQGVGNSITITNTKSNINSANIVFVTEPDSTGNVTLAYSQSKYNSIFGNITQATNVAISANCTSTESEYSLTTSLGYTEDDTVAMIWSITDTDPYANSYTSTFVQTAGNTGAFLINGISQGVGNAATVTGNKATVNAANVSFLPYCEDTGNISIGYSQSKINSIFGNVVQATNVAIALTNTANHAEYSLTTAYTYPEGGANTIVWDVLDQDARATSYTATFTQTTGNSGVFLINGTSQGVGTAAVITGNLATVNAANVTFVPYPDYTGNVDMTWNLSKVNSIFGNIGLASNVAIQFTNNGNVDSNSYVWNSGTYIQNSIVPFGNVIADSDSFAPTYTSTWTQTAGNTGYWYSGTTGNYTYIGSAATPLVITNSKATINNNYNFFPELQSTGNVTITYSQVKNNTLFGNISQASNVAATFACSANVDFVTNLANGSSRTFAGNTITNIFANSTPQISDGSTVPLQSYTIYLAAATGRFNSAPNPFTTVVDGMPAAVANLQIGPGNITTVNAALANVYYCPTYQQTANTTFTYTQLRSGPGSTISQTVRTIDLNHVANPLTDTYEFSYTGPATYRDDTWTPSVLQRYYGNVQVIIVGGGGGEAATAVSGEKAGGGGGHIMLKNFNNWDAQYGLSGANINIETGQGNGVGSDGRGSMIWASSWSNVANGGLTGILAFGFGSAGAGGTVYTDNGATGNRGGNSSFTGLNGTTTNYFGVTGNTVFGGGGASPAGNASGSNGANGYTWSVTGNTYAGGGGGTPSGTQGTGNVACGGTAGTNAKAADGGTVIIAIR